MGSESSPQINLQHMIALKHTAWDIDCPVMDSLITSAECILMPIASSAEQIRDWPDSGEDFLSPVESYNQL